MELAGPESPGETAVKCQYIVVIVFFCVTGVCNSIYFCISAFILLD